MQKEQMQYMQQHFAAHQNDTLKLNSGQQKEAIILVMQAFANWINMQSFPTYHVKKDLFKGDQVAKKKTVKKVKPAKPSKKAW